MLHMFRIAPPPYGMDSFIKEGRSFHPCLAYCIYTVALDLNIVYYLPSQIITESNMLNISEKRMLNRFFNRQPQTFKEALPRTVAPVTAAISGLGAGGFVGGMLGLFAGIGESSSQTSSPEVWACVAAITLAAAAGGSGLGYIFGHGATNAFMGMYPEIRNKTSRFLLSPGRKGQIGLFFATAAIIPTVIVGNEVLKDYKRNLKK
jgi:hypothetical protein